MIGDGLEFLHELQAILDIGMTDNPQDAAQRTVEWLRERITRMDLDEKTSRILQMELLANHCQLITKTILVYTAICPPKEPWEG